MIQRTILATLASLTFMGLQTQAWAQFLGTADSFAVLGGQTVTNTGSTVLSGNLGVWPGTSITGFPPGLVTNGTIYMGTSEAMNAQADLTTAYTLLALEPFDQDLTGQNLGGMTLLPGVYHFSSSAFLTGTLKLDTQGDPDARFVFQMGSTLITDGGSQVQVIGSEDVCNIFWQVGSSATLGVDSLFAGHILALTDIGLLTGANIVDGSALARNGQVTLQNNHISTCVTPEPATVLGLSAGLAAVAARRRRKSVGF